MSRSHFWLREEQFEQIARRLPTDTRGVAQVEDRRVISGIIHVLRSGCRWKDAPDVYGPHKTRYNRFGRCTAKGVWTALFQTPAQVGGRPAEVLIDSSAVRAHRSAAAAAGKRGKQSQAIGRSRAGRRTKILALSNWAGRPIAFLLTGAQIADCTSAQTLIGRLTPGVLLHGDKGDDTNAVRVAIEDRGATPNIPRKITRRPKRVPAEAACARGKDSLRYGLR